MPASSLLRDATASLSQSLLGLDTLSSLRTGLADPRTVAASAPTLDLTTAPATARAILVNDPG